jgi:hypothetical protein
MQGKNLHCPGSFYLFPVLFTCAIQKLDAGQLPQVGTTELAVITKDNALHPVYSWRIESAKQIGLQSAANQSLLLPHARLLFSAPPRLRDENFLPHLPLNVQWTCSPRALGTPIRNS